MSVPKRCEVTYTCHDVPKESPARADTCREAHPSSMFFKIQFEHFGDKSPRGQDGRTKLRYRRRIVTSGLSLLRGHNFKCIWELEISGSLILFWSYWLFIFLRHANRDGTHCCHCLHNCLFSLTDVHEISVTGSRILSFVFARFILSQERRRLDFYHPPHAKHKFKTVCSIMISKSSLL